jgi:hypothetical protein
MVQLRGARTLANFFLLKNLVCKTCIGKDGKALSVEAQTELVINNGTLDQTKASGTSARFLSAMKRFEDRVK